MFITFLYLPNKWAKTLCNKRKDNCISDRIKGPSLPVFIAQETGLSILFASAFLSELIADKRLKISNMHVGSSPLYLVPGQEPMLENFSQYLKNKEKEAYLFKRKEISLRTKN